MNTVLVGAGYWGKNFERILKKTSNNLNLKYIVDSNIEIDGYTCFKNIDELDTVLNDIQCAIVCTPTQTHHTIVDYFLDNKINVLVEKPLTVNSKNAKELFEKAAQNNLVLLVDHTFLYNSSIDYLKKIIESEELGNIVHLSFERTNLNVHSMISVSKSKKFMIQNYWDIKIVLYRQVGFTQKSRKIKLLEQNGSF